MLGECDAPKRDTSETAAPCELRGAAVCVCSSASFRFTFRLVYLHLSSSTFILSRPLLSPCPFSSASSLFTVLYPPSLSSSFLILPHPSSSLPLLPPDACFIFATTVTRALHNETFQETVPKQDELVLYDWRRMRDGACFAYRRRVRHERKELLWILGMPHGCWYPPALCF